MIKGNSKIKRFRPIRFLQMKRTFSCLLVFIFMTTTCFSQEIAWSKNKFYIPKNIDECNQELSKFLTKKSKANFKSIHESSLNNVHGIFVFSEWLSTDTSRLVRHFSTYFIDNDEDQRYLLTLAYHRSLNNKLFDLAFEAKKITQRQDSIEAIRELDYKKNIISDSIDGIYIPEDIYSCFSQLDLLLCDSTKQELKSKASSNEMTDYHMGLGRWMRNRWQLWSSSRLKAYFHNKGITHPDNISGIILASYWMYLNQKDIDIDQIIYEDLNQEPAILVPPILFNKKKFYTKEYRRFLRTRKIRRIHLSS
ncbi:hypothetical protein HNQ92_004272 [Rhabdobacter roseus]|uniref:DUF6794 domain-containing protein n=1 Tax=Rhabdobacter roseus TaxID=1655419 RepID=A0A840TWY3_9BACT|nr:DUF6794 domain-containing protein [Rhabdobacter roseus]MBB5286112.1 hypothetical protein [Rhabdobacter roseus]